MCVEPNTVPVTVWMNAGLVRWLKGDAGLFGFEQVEGNGPGAVGLEEFGLLGFECALLAGEVLGVLVDGGVEAVEFVVEVLRWFASAWG